MKNQKRFGKLLITLLSTGVLLAALQSQEIITAEEATTAATTTTTEQTTAATATTEATTEATTTAAPTHAAKEVDAKVTGTITNHDIKYYEYYTDVNLSVSLLDGEAKEGDYVTIQIENATVLNSLDGKDVFYDGKKIGTISVVSFENINKARQGSNDAAQMQQAELESTRETLKITFTKDVETVRPDVLKQAKFDIKSDNSYNGAVIANKDYTLNQVIKVGSSSVTNTVDIPKVEKFATDTNSINFTPSGNTIKFNPDGSYETETQFQVRGTDGMKVGSTVELEFNDASGIEWKTSGDDALKVGDTFTSHFILPVYQTYAVNQYGAYVFPTGVEPTFKVTSVTDKKITFEMISGNVPKELGVFFGVGKNRINIIDKSKIDVEKMQYDVSTVATASVDGQNAKGIYIYRIISDSASAQLVRDTLITEFKEIDTEKTLRPSEKGYKDKVDIDGYEFVKTTKDREGNQTHWYKKVEQSTTTTTTEAPTTTTTPTEAPTTTTTTTETPTPTPTTEAPATTTTTETPTPTPTPTTTEEPTNTSATTTTEKTTDGKVPGTNSTTTESKEELPNTGSTESLFATGVAFLVAGLTVLGLKKKDS